MYHDIFLIISDWKRGKHNRGISDSNQQNREETEEQKSERKWKVWMC